MHAQYRHNTTTPAATSGTRSVSELSQSTAKSKKGCHECARTPGKGICSQKGPNPVKLRLSMRNATEVAMGKTVALAAFGPGSLCTRLLLTASLSFTPRQRPSTNAHPGTSQPQCLWLSPRRWPSPPRWSKLKLRWLGEAGRRSWRRCRSNLHATRGQPGHT